jgi:hypothetical protein
LRRKEICGISIYFVMKGEEREMWVNQVLIACASFFFFF